MNLDLLVIGPHPDDAELGAGGLLARAAARGQRAGILDLTRGELGSRGTLETRTAEAQEAAQILGVSVRENVALPDGALADTPAQRATLVSAIRRLRPRIVLAPMSPDRHPDHEAAHALACAANFLAGLSKVDDGQPPHRAETVLFYHPYAQQEQLPTLIQDISETFAQKIEALRAYRSQFFNPEYSGQATFVSSEAFWEGILHRAAYWGARIGVKYAEPFYARAPLALDVLDTWRGK